METEKCQYRKKGTSIIGRAIAEERRQFFLRKKVYWEQFEQKKGQHEIVKNALLNMQEPSGEFLIMPRPLEQFFLLYLNKYHASQQNIQRALNITRVYSLLVHQYYKSATKFDMIASFYVSPSIWEKWLIGRKAKENSIKILKEMGLIISYRFNRNKGAPAEESRFVVMYQFNLQKVKWLYACVKTLSTLEEGIDEHKNAFNYDDIAEDIFGYIEKSER